MKQVVWNRTTKKFHGTKFYGRLDTTFKFRRTKFDHVAWALVLSNLGGLGVIYREH